MKLEVEWPEDEEIDTAIEREARDSKFGLRLDDQSVVQPSKQGSFSVPVFGPNRTIVFAGMAS